MSDPPLKPGDVVRVLGTGMRARVVALAEGCVTVRPVSGRVLKFRESELQKIRAEDDGERS
jgi:preprotein translocase subunit YajC